MMIRPVKKSDARAICGIYNPYVLESIITFEEAPVSIEEMESRIASISAALPWLVFEQEQRVVGYAYAAQWRSRSAFRYSVESTVYVSPDCTKQNIGSRLYAELIKQLKEKQIHTVIGGIALPNEGSIKLHERAGFEKTAHFKNVGWKFGKWIDLGYWQLNLNVPDPSDGISPPC